MVGPAVDSGKLDLFVNSMPKAILDIPLAFISCLHVDVKSSGLSVLCFGWGWVLCLSLIELHNEKYYWETPHPLQGQGWICWSSCQLVSSTSNPCNIILWQLAMMKKKSYFPESSPCTFVYGWSKLCKSLFAFWLYLPESLESNYNLSLITTWDRRIHMFVFLPNDLA